MIRGCEIEGVEAIGDVDARCRLRDRRQRPWELLLSFESDRPLCEAAAEVAEQGISHLALFVSDGHARTQ